MCCLCVYESVAHTQSYNTCCGDNEMKSFFSSSSSPCSHRVTCSALQGLLTCGLDRNIIDRQHVAGTESVNGIKKDLTIVSTFLLSVFTVGVCWLTMSPRTAELPEERCRTFFLSEL